MTKDIIIFGLLLLLAVLALGTAARPEAVIDAPMLRADYQRCVPVDPGPLVQHRGVNLYPGRKDIA